MKGKKVCYFHGGRSKSGAESGTYVDGRYIESLKKTRLGPKMQEAANDPLLLELMPEIALTQALIDELCSKFEYGDGEGGGAIARILKHYEKCVDAANQKDWNKFNALFAQMGGIIESAGRDFALMDEIKGMIRTKKDLVEAQHKRNIQLDQMMRAADVKILINRVMGELRGVVFDRLEDKDLATRILVETATKASRVLDGGHSENSHSALEDGSIS